tara:strand:+ start:88 stop:228 length:141 start_codon:yes stop_codon:yes gene_type:complete
MKVTKKELLIGSVFMASLLIFPAELFLGMLLTYFIYLIYKNYQWKK